MSVTRSL